MKGSVFKETVMCHRLFNGLLIELIINLKFLRNGTLRDLTVIYEN